MTDKAKNRLYNAGVAQEWSPRQAASRGDLRASIEGAAAQGSIQNKMRPVLQVGRPADVSLSAMNANQLSNRLLMSLEGADLALLTPHLREASLRQGQIVQEQEAPVERVYFPLNCVISLISVMNGGEVVETATIGREGAVGAFAGFGPWHAFSRATVRLPGQAATISAADFQAATKQSERIGNMVLRYKESLLAQVQQTAACNALHQLEARLARWLLQTLDRTDDPRLPLTQDLIAQMLSVRRSTVTVVAGKLQEAGLIRYHRGRIDVLDRPRLEETACECYATIRQRTEAVFNRPED
jgi:CRP-like cAMP-binding protein